MCEILKHTYMNSNMTRWLMEEKLQVFTQRCELSRYWHDQWN